MDDRYVSVHPVALAMAAAAGAHVKSEGGTFSGQLHESGGALRYLVRMGLFDFIELEPPIVVAEHEPAGRFIPLTQIRSPDELSRYGPIPWGQGPKRVKSWSDSVVSRDRLDALKYLERDAANAQRGLKQTELAP
jgi:hypothetical protein